MHTPLLPVCACLCRPPRICPTSSVRHSCMLISCNIFAFCCCCRSLPFNSLICSSFPLCSLSQPYRTQRPPCSRSQITMQAPSLLAPKTKSKKSFLEQPLPKGKADVSLSAFGYLFMEVCSNAVYAHAVTLCRSCLLPAKAPLLFPKLKHV